MHARGAFVWYELITTDLQEAKRFYTRVMGWGAWDGSRPGKACILFTDRKTSIAGLTELPDDARRTGARPGWIGYVEVDDVAASVARIQSLGGTVSVPPTDVADMSRFAIFADPQAARLAIFKWLKAGYQEPAEPDRPGRVVWHELVASNGESAWAFYGALFGWQEADAETDETGTYRLFSAGRHVMGGILTKRATVSEPFWLYYFAIDDVEAAARRVEAEGGRILDGPVAVPGDSWIVRCEDPQGAVFALEGSRKGRIGYFTRGAADARRRWSW
jgi:predicted enzyme related to lactoylglutathione lyase